MSEYVYTKILGKSVALLMLISAIGLRALNLLGTSLSEAWYSSIDYSSESRFVLLVCLSLAACSFIIGLGSFWLSNISWRLFYIGFCFLLGAGFLVGFFVSYGALGTKNEVFILIIGTVYLLLSFMVQQKKRAKKRNPQWIPLLLCFL